MDNLQDEASSKPHMEVMCSVASENCEAVLGNGDDRGDQQDKTSENGSSLCFMCGSSEGSVSAFARLGIGGCDTEPLVSVLSSILKKSVVDIPMHTDVVCSKCFKKFESILKLQNRLEEMCRDVIHCFNKAVVQFVKTVNFKREDSDTIPVISDVDMKRGDCGIVTRAFTLANSKKEKKQDTKYERKYKCQVCDKAFIAYSHRVEHMLTHTKEKSFKCDICGMHTTTKSNLTRHKQQHSKECVCNVCNRKLCSKGSLRDHMKIHNSEKPHHCQYCGKSFNRFQDRRVHEKLHKIEETGSFQCNVCEKRFVIQSRLARHMLIHEKEKQFVCPVCNKKFSRKDDLKTHERSHTGERPYFCKECGRTFRYISNCRHHMKIHMKETDVHRCTICNISFPSKAKYEYHLKTRTHKKKMAESVFGSTENVHCSSCKNSFSPSDYMKHKGTCTGKTLKQEATEEHFSCRMCCLSFENIEQLSEHSLHAHPIEASGLSQVSNTGIIISTVSEGEELVNLTPLTVTGDSVNMVVEVEPNNTLGIPVVQNEVTATTASLLPTSTLISGTNGELTEITAGPGIISEVVSPTIVEHTINANDPITILNPSTIFKIGDWDIQ